MRKALFLCVILAGCATKPLPLTYHRWVKVGGNMEMLNADGRECAASNSVSSHVVSGGGAAAAEVLHVDALDGDRFAACMNARGWTLDDSKQS